MNWSLLRSPISSIFVLLILISLIASLLTIQIKRNKVLQFIIIMPFYVPIIIFTTSNYDGIFYSSLELNKILILIGFFLITLPITLLLGKLILNEINKWFLSLQTPINF